MTVTKHFYDSLLIENHHSRVFLKKKKDLLNNEGFSQILQWIENSALIHNTEN